MLQQEIYALTDLGEIQRLVGEHGWGTLVSWRGGLRPSALDTEQTYRVLERTVGHVESGRPDPWQLDFVEGYARSVAPYTTGFPLMPSRSVAKQNLRQDKPEPVASRVTDALAGDGIDHQPALAQAVERASARS
jgi:transcriptional regulator